MAQLAERMSDLELALEKMAYAQFNTQLELQRLSNEMREFKSEMKDFKDEMKDFKDEMKDFKDEMKDFKDEMKGFKGEMKDFKDEMTVFKDEMTMFKDEMRRDRADMNKRWGELANKLGTVVEDIVLPNIPRVARDYLGCAELEFIAPRVYKRMPGDGSRRREFDVVAVCGDRVILNETKATARLGSVMEFVDFLKRGEFFEYFPEYSGRRLIPVFAALAIPEDLVAVLTREGVYAMAMGDETMDLLNAKELVAAP